MQHTKVVLECPQLEIGYQGIRGRPLVCEDPATPPLISRPVPGDDTPPSTSIYEIRDIFFTTPPKRIKRLCPSAPKKPKKYDKERFEKAYKKIFSRKESKSVAKKVRRENKVAKDLNIKIKRMTKEEYELLRLYASIDWLNARSGPKYRRGHDIGKSLSVGGPKGRLGRTGHDPFKNLDIYNVNNFQEDEEEEKKSMVRAHEKAQLRKAVINPLDYLHSELDLKYVGKDMQEKIINSEIYSKQSRELYYEQIHLEGGLLRQDNEDMETKLEKLKEEKGSLIETCEKFDNEIRMDPKCDIVPLVEFLNL